MVANPYTARVKFLCASEVPDAIPAQERSGRLSQACPGLLRDRPRLRIAQCGNAALQSQQAGCLVERRARTSWHNGPLPTVKRLHTTSGAHRSLIDSCTHATMPLKDGTGMRTGCFSLPSFVWPHKCRQATLSGKRPKIGQFIIKFVLSQLFEACNRYSFVCL